MIPEKIKTVNKTNTVNSTGGLKPRVSKTLQTTTYRGNRVKRDKYGFSGLFESVKLSPKSMLAGSECLPTDPVLVHCFCSKIVSIAGGKV